MSKIGLEELPPAKSGARRRVLITGVTSTLGRQLAERLMYDKKVDCVMGVAMDDTPYYFEDFDQRRFVYKKVNILKSRELTNLFLSDEFKSREIDTVVHLAFHHRPEFNNEKVHQLNVEGTKNLLDRCLETGTIRKFVFKSSALVYKIRPHNPIRLRENDDLNFDVDAHPIVKDMVDAEMLCRAKMDNKSMQIVILRPSATIGRNVTTFYNSFLESSVCLQIAGFNPMVNLVHSRDVVRAVQLGIHKNTQGIFNIGGKETAPVSDFVKLSGAVQLSVPGFALKPITRMLRLAGLSKFDPSTDMERLRFSCLLDTDKASKVLGYEPQHHIKFS
ncbi:MAG: NAD-dependent epimerase/dehydratase family protein [Chrysiogenetes bacterium]|nr:NAD-dependent epimerase/dehydratase family protein [Chrysiogenetes bacterium]